MCKQFVIYVLADVITFVYEVATIIPLFWSPDGVSWITLKKYYKVRWNYYKLRQLSILQSAMDSYYKLRQLFYFKVRHCLLQIATGITKCDDYYKLRQLSLLQSAMDSYYKLRQLFYYKVRHCLLQIATGITKCDDYYKLRQCKYPRPRKHRIIHLK